MLKQIILDAKARYAEDYKDEPHLEEQLVAFEEGMISAFTLMFEQSLHGSISFDVIE